MDTQQINEVWQRTLLALEPLVGKSAVIGKASYEAYIKNTKPVKFEDNKLILEAPNEFVKEFIQGHYGGLIKEIINNLLGKKFEIVFTAPAQTEVETEKQVITDQRDIKKQEVKPTIQLNVKYTFDTFVVGNSNRLAYAAALAVANSPCKSYNPLFIYGGVGLGKTHLLQAIGYHILSNFQDLRVCYTTTEAFTNKVVNCITKGNPEELRTIYRDNIDVLLIDDIQFLIGKERTQEEFFHTFNTLYEDGKQLVISSDRPPRELTILEDRLVSRFSWGLIADIQKPDLETRLAILHKRLADSGLNITIPDEVFLVVATEFQDNIRDLEGALNKIIAHILFENKEVNAVIVKDLLKDMLPNKIGKGISIYKIQKVVADYFNIKVEDLTSLSRVKEVVLPRQIAMYLSRELSNDSLMKIGELFGKRDHTTVIHAHEKIKKEIKEDPIVEKYVNELWSLLKNYV